MWFYTGTQPATPETATAETKLAMDALSAPAGAIGASGYVATLTLTVPKVCSVDVSGLVGWVRFVDAAGAGLMDLPCGVIGGLEPVILSTLAIFAGGELQLLSCVVSE
jgi:hypothetical protein